ncbi:hypothetical protein TH62_07250 [Bacillus sp. TH008]|nr:hypothetical protein TH62_07250 [Bacillus sp. TH008]
MSGIIGDISIKRVEKSVSRNGSPPAASAIRILAELSSGHGALKRGFQPLPLCKTAYVKK